MPCGLQIITPSCLVEYYESTAVHDPEQFGNRRHFTHDRRAIDRHQNGRAIAIDDRRRVVLERLSLRLLRCPLDGQLRFQALTGNYPGLRGQSLAQCIEKLA